MSAGLTSPARLVCVVPSIAPEFRPSVGLKSVVEKLVLSIGWPSTTNSGWALPEFGRPTVRWPRIWMYEPEPGSPLEAVTSTFGAFAANASTMFHSLLRAIRSALTACRTLPSFSTSVAVPAPVTTTSPSCSGFAASAKSCVTAPGASVIWALCAL